MHFVETSIGGCFEIVCPQSTDSRGQFVKTYRADLFKEQGLRQDWREEYYSISRRDVIRGMHFQSPPMDHAKMVHCLEGAILDVVLDLRSGSPTYGQTASFELSAKKANSLYLPAGIAHGFLSLKDRTIVQYKVTSVYSATNDMGLLWSSIGFEWPVSEPTVSKRDSEHPSFAFFKTPF